MQKPILNLILSWRIWFSDLANKVFIFVFIGIFCSLCFPLSSNEAKTEPSISIIYPELRKPYDSLYQQTRAGIKASFNGNINELEVEKNYQLNEIRQWVQNSDSQVLITLGQRGAAVCQQLRPTTPIVLGAVLFVPEPCSDRQLTVSLTPEPKQLFERLNQIKPEIDTVYVVYDPQVNQWLIDIAKRQAQLTGLNIIAVETKNLLQSAKIYREILSKLDPLRESIWLLQDRKSIDNTTLLPMLLREAWAHQIILFSSNLAHVQKGALFALYPDNFALGSYLGSLAHKALDNLPFNNQVQPLPHPKGALNLRVAKHLGVTLTSQTTATYDLFFPNK